MKIVNNPFVMRQTPESPFSHYTGDMSRLPELVKAHINTSSEQGFRDGVISVRVPPKGFRSGVVLLSDGDELQGSFTRRRKGEAPRKQINAPFATKIAASQVDIILYRSDVLAEDGDNFLHPSPANWEIVSINASPVEGDIPIHPMTLMHNHFKSDGGTATNMTDKEFVSTLRKGFAFWSNKAMAG